MDAFIESLRQVYELLEDEESRVTYLNWLNYLVSGDLRYKDDAFRGYVQEAAEGQLSARDNAISSGSAVAA